MESFAVQRKNMVEHQVRTSDVTDRRIDQMIEEADWLRGTYAVGTGHQRAPYFEVQAERFALIVADTGILRDMDADQLRWLGAQRTEVAIRAVPGGAAAAAERLRALDGVREVTVVEESPEEGTVLLVESASDRRAQIARALVEGGWDVLRLGHTQRRLESLFLGLLHGAERTRGLGHPAA